MVLEPAAWPGAKASRSCLAPHRKLVRKRIKDGDVSVRFEQTDMFHWTCGQKWEPSALSGIGPPSRIGAPTLGKQDIFSQKITF